MANPNTLFDLKENSEVRLNGLTLLKVTSVGTPMLKATISAQILNGEESCIYDGNKEDWQELDDLEAVVIGVGDKLIIGDVQILMTSLSKKFSTIRLSLRSENESTSHSIRKAAGKI